MKKISLKKTVLASTMAFTLALGTAVPAFAADAEQGELLSGQQNAETGEWYLASDENALWTDQTYGPSDFEGVDGGANTLVGVFTKVGQMKVSVPTHMALAIKANGGDFMAPTARTTASGVAAGEGAADSIYRKGTGYGIENLGGMPVAVTNIAGSVVSEEGAPVFSLSSTKQTALTKPAAGTNLTIQMDLTPGTPTTSVTKTVSGKQQVTVNPANATAVTAGKVSLTEAGASLTTTQLAAWTIEAADVAASGDINAKVLPVNVTGSTSRLEKAEVGATAQLSTDAVNVTYTIAMA